MICFSGLLELAAVSAGRESLYPEWSTPDRGMVIYNKRALALDIDHLSSPGMRERSTVVMHHARILLTVVVKDATVDAREEHRQRGGRVHQIGCVLVADGVHIEVIQKVACCRGD